MEGAALLINDVGEPVSPGHADNFTLSLKLSPPGEYASCMFGVKHCAGLCTFLALFAGCATSPGPRDTLTAYRDALAKKDAAAIAKLESSSLRARHDAAALQAALQSQAEVSALLADLAAPVMVESAELTLKSGRRVRLVREDGAWRVVEGGIDRWLPETPGGALAAFFSAVDARRLDEVRRFIPDEGQANLADDAALLRHLEAQKERIAAARAGLEPLGDRSAIVSGDEAIIRYAPGKAARLVRQSGVWRIADLE